MYGGDRSLSQSADDNLSDSFSDSNEHPSWANFNRESIDATNSPSNSRVNSAKINRSIECSSVEVRICDTELVTTQGKVGSNVHVVYIINVSPGISKSWLVRRRFNDFVFLDKQLRKQTNQTNIKLPNLPRKRYFGSSTEPRFVEERRIYLEEYLQTLAAIPLVWIKSDFARFLDNENNSMIFIWNFERVRKMQENLTTITMENKAETFKLSEELNVYKQQVSQLQERIARMEMLFLQNNSSLLSDVALTSVIHENSTNSSQISQSNTTIDDISITNDHISTVTKKLATNDLSLDISFDNSIKLFLDYSAEQSKKDSSDSFMSYLTYYFDQMIEVLIPSNETQENRRKVYEYVRQLLFTNLGVHTLPVGSFVSNTYLPNGDIDITALFIKPDDESWFVKTNEILCYTAYNPLSAVVNTSYQDNYKYGISNVSFINAEIKLIKSTINNTSVDISANQIGGLYIQIFLESIDMFIGQNHLFKRSSLLIKAWCNEESSKYSNNQGSIHGSKEGRLSTSCINIMIVWIFNCYGSKISHPIQALYYFLKFYSKFDWNKYALTIYGPKSVIDLSDIDKQEDFSDIPMDMFIPIHILDFYKDRYMKAYESNLANAMANLLAQTNTNESIDTPRSLSSSMSISNSLSLPLDESQMVESLSNTFIMQCAFADTTAFYKRGLMNIINGVAPKNNLSRSVDNNGYQAIQMILKNGLKSIEILIYQFYNHNKNHHYNNKIERFLSTSMNYLNIISKYSISLYSTLCCQAIYLLVYLSSSIFPNNNKAKLSDYIDVSTSQSTSKPTSNYYVDTIISYLNNTWINVIKPLLYIQKKKYLSMNEINMNKSDNDIDLLATNWEDLEFSLCFAEASLGCNIRSEMIITVVTEILSQKGSLPVGEIGKFIQAAFGCDISKRVKDQFGGLKKTLESSSETIHIGNEHPFNPMVVLDNSKILSTYPTAFTRFYHSSRIMSSVLSTIVAKDNASIKSSKKNYRNSSYKGNSFSEFGYSNESNSSLLKSNRYIKNPQSSLMSVSNYSTPRVMPQEETQAQINYQTNLNVMNPTNLSQIQLPQNNVIYQNNQTVPNTYFQYVYNPSSGTNSPTSVTPPTMAFQILNQGSYQQQPQFYYIPMTGSPTAIYSGENSVSIPGTPVYRGDNNIPIVGNVPIDGNTLTGTPKYRVNGSPQAIYKSHSSESNKSYNGINRSHSEESVKGNNSKTSDSK